MDINRYLTVRWAQAAGTLTGVARDQAHERYEGWTKVELSDQLARRNLPKTGTVDELTERLIGADSK